MIIQPGHELYETAMASVNARKLSDSFDVSTPSDDYHNQAERAKQYIVFFSDFIKKESWRRVPALKSTKRDEHLHLIIEVEESSDGKPIIYEYKRLGEWLAAPWLHGGCNADSNLGRVATVLRWIKGEELLKAIYDKDRKAYHLVRQRIRQDSATKPIEPQQLAIFEAATVQPIAEHGGDRKSDQGNKTENVTLIEQRGNNQPYRIAKLKRDYPAIAERLQSGEFKNVREAERAAGLNVPPKLSRVRKLIRAYDRLTESEQNEFREAIG